MAFFQATRLWVEEIAEQVAAVVLDGPGKANSLDRTFLEEIDQALSVIEKEPRFQWCLLRSKKAAGFCHGVAAATWYDLQAPEQRQTFQELGHRLCDRLTQLRLPTVAVITGACLGAGLELALACDWRIAVAAPNTHFGFTELEVGLAPSWGGVGRLLGLVGLERGIQMLLGGKKLSAAVARSWGLVDEIAEVAWGERPTQPPRKRDVHRRPRRTWRQRLLESTALGRRLVLRGAERVLRRRLPDDMPAPWETLSLVRTVVERGNEEGHRQERAILDRLAASPASRNLLRLQVLHDGRSKADAELPRPKRIGILGATPLALHLATQAAVKGCQVALHEKDELTLGMASLQLVKILQEGVERGATAAENLESNINRIRPTVSWKGFDEVEMVIDATHGAIEAEQRLARELESHVSDDAVIACVRPWRALAGWRPLLRCPGRALTLHLPAPVGRTPMLELLAGPATGTRAVNCVRGFAAMLRKITIVAQEQTGGLLQRVLSAGFSEALHLLQEGQPPERLDQVMHRFGMAHGLLEHLDLIGLDEFMLTAERVATALDERIAENAVIQHMIKQRWLGVKTGVGFYDHTGSSTTPNRALGHWLARSYARKTTPSSAGEQKNMIVQRLVGRMVNEAFRCLDEAVVVERDDIDLALMAVGWAPHRGGPCRYAEQIGYAALISQLEQMTTTCSGRFAPCPMLCRLATS